MAFTHELEIVNGTIDGLTFDDVGATQPSTPEWSLPGPEWRFGEGGKYGVKVVTVLGALAVVGGAAYWYFKMR